MIFRYPIQRGRLLACWLPLALGVHAAEPFLEDAATGPTGGRDLPLWVSDTGVLSEDDIAASTAEADALKLQDLASQAERRHRTLALLALDQGVDRAGSDELLLAQPETDADTDSDEKATAQAGMFADTHVQAEIAKATKVANFLASDAKELSKQLKLIRGPLFRRLTGGHKEPRQAPQEARPNTEVQPEPEAPRKTGGTSSEGDDEEALEAEGDGGGDNSYVHEDADRVEPVSKLLKEQTVSLMAKHPRLPDPEDSLQLTDSDKEEDENFEDVDPAPAASLVGKGKKLHERTANKGSKGSKKGRVALPAGLPVDDLEPFGVNGKPAGEVAPLSAVSAGARKAPREEEEEEELASEDSEDESLVEPGKAHRRVDEEALQPDGGDGDGDNQGQGHHHGHHGGDGGNPHEEGHGRHHHAEEQEHTKAGASTAMRALHVVILVLVIAFLILWVYHVRRRLNEAAAAKAAEEEKRKKDEEEGKVDPAADGEKKEGGEEGEKKGKFSGFLNKK